jgi:hypothetical protein
MRISIPLDLSSRPFIPLPRFMRSRRAATLSLPPFFYSAANKLDLNGMPSRCLEG